MTHILLDTNVLIWALLEPARLPGDIAGPIRDPGNKVWFSAASIWEIAIKKALGRVRFTRDPSAVLEVALKTGFSELPVRSDAAILVASLPMHHKDPFDRLLVAQAIFEPVNLITADRLLTRYSELVRAFNPL
jgi:PIN domain nuclease of toxin-antitoxin system